jgi:putative endonuclease
MKFSTCIIQSETTGKWYYGHNEHPKIIFEQHNSGRNKSTKSGIPWQLIFLREFASKKEAVNFEAKLKKLRNKEYICSRFAEFFISGCSAVR